VGISCVDRERAGLTIWRVNDCSCQNRLAVLFVGPLVMVVVYFLDLAHVGMWVTGDRVILAIKFADPLVVGGISGSVDSINDAFVLVTFLRVNDSVDFGRTRSELRLGFV